MKYLDVMLYVIVQFHDQRLKNPSSTIPGQGTPGGYRVLVTWSLNLPLLGSLESRFLFFFTRPTAINKLPTPLPPNPSLATATLPWLHMELGLQWMISATEEQVGISSLT